MCTDKSDKNQLEFIIDVSHQSVLISFYVEYHSAITNNICVLKLLFQIV